MEVLEVTKVEEEDVEPVPVEEARRRVERLRPTKPPTRKFTKTFAILRSQGAAVIHLKDSKELAGTRISLGHRATDEHMEIRFGYDKDTHELWVYVVRDDLTDEEIQLRKGKRSGKRKQTETAAS